MKLLIFFPTVFVSKLTKNHGLAKVMNTTFPIFLHLMHNSIVCISLYLVYIMLLPQNDTTILPYFVLQG